MRGLFSTIPTDLWLTACLQEHSVIILMISAK